MLCLSLPKPVLYQLHLHLKLVDYHMLNYLRVTEDVNIVFALYVVINVFLFSVPVEPLEVLVVFVLLEQADCRSNSSLVIVKRYNNLMMWITLLYQ